MSGIRPGRRRRELALLPRTRDCGGRAGSRSSLKQRTRDPQSSRHRACDRASGSGSAGRQASSISSRRTSGTSRRSCRSSTTRIPCRCWRTVAHRHCTSCGCTTAPSGDGIDRCTTSSTRRPTSVWRTACCPPGQRSSTCWRTAPSTTGRSACWPPRNVHCGHRWRSRQLRRTSRSRPTGHRRPGLLARSWRAARERARAASSAAVGPPGPAGVGSRR